VEKGGILHPVRISGGQFRQATVPPPRGRRLRCPAREERDCFRGRDGLPERKSISGDRHAVGISGAFGQDRREKVNRPQSAAACPFFTNFHPDRPVRSPHADPMSVFSRVNTSLRSRRACDSRFPRGMPRPLWVSASVAKGSGKGYGLAGHCQYDRTRWRNVNGRSGPLSCNEEEGPAYGGRSLFKSRRRLCHVYEGPFYSFQ